MFHEISQEIESGLLRALRRGPAPHGGRRSPSAWTGRWSPRAPGFLPDSVPRWKPFKETNAAAREDRQDVRDRARSRTSTTSCSARRAGTCPPTSTSSSPPSRCAPTSPIRRTSRSSQRRIEGDKKGWVHIAVEPVPRRRAARQAQGARDLGQPRRARPSRPGRKAPDAEVSTLPEAAKLLGALGAAVRAISLHPDVLVATSEVWQTTCTAVRSGGEAFVIDSPVYPDELELLPTLDAAGAVHRSKGLLVTHGDWDHLLGRLAFPGAALGCAETTAARLTRRARGRPARAARLRRRALRRARGAAVARPGPGAAGARPLRGRRRASSSCTRPTGHTADGMAIWVPWAQVLVVRRLPLAGRDPDALGDRLARRLRRDAAAAGAARRAGRRTSCRATARRWRAPARAGDPARGRRVPRGARRTRTLPLARRGPAQQGVHTAQRRACIDRRRCR